MQRWKLKSNNQVNERRGVGFFLIINEEEDKRLIISLLINSKWIKGRIER